VSSRAYLRLPTHEAGHAHPGRRPEAVHGRVPLRLAEGLLPLRILADLTNIGTLFAFVVVCAAVLIMRRLEPNAERPFRAPLSPFVPVAGILTCLMLMFSLPAENWYRLIIWLALGMVIYVFYSRHHSVMAKYLLDQESHGALGLPVKPPPHDAPR